MSDSLYDRPSGLGRSYSLASVPRLEPDLDIHVKRMPAGKLSNWIYEDVHPGANLELIHADPFDFKDLRAKARDEGQPRADVW